jgi:outer membrane protein assembly factor BamB
LDTAQTKFCHQIIKIILFILFIPVYSQLLSVVICGVIRGSSVFLVFRPLKENHMSNETEKESVRKNGGQPERKPASTTIRPRPTNASVTSANRRPAPGAKPPKKGFGVEILMAMVLAALIIGIVIVLIIGNTRPTPSTNVAIRTPDPAALERLTPKNDATVLAALGTVNSSTAVPLPPTPTGAPVSSLSDTGGNAWTMAGGNPARTRYTSAKVSLPLKKLWDSQATGELAASPAVADGLAFFGSSTGAFYGVDVQTGQVKWTRNLGPIASSPAVAGNTVYFGTTSGFVHALDTKTGQDRWNPFPTIEGVVSSPVVTGGVVYIGTNLSNVLAIDANLGRRLWNISLGMPGAASVTTAPALADGMIYFGATNGVFYAYDITAAEPVKKWSVEIPDKKPLLSSPAVADGLVYFAAENKIQAFDAKTGAKKWAADLEAPSSSSPALANGVLYIGSNSKKVYAFEAASGTKKWEFTGDGLFTAAPIVANDVLFIGGNDTKLYALDTATGTKKWEFATGDLIVSSPAVAGGKVFVTSLDGKLYAFGS